MQFLIIILLLFWSNSRSSEAEIVVRYARTNRQFGQYESFAALFGPDLSSPEFKNAKYFVLLAEPDIQGCKGISPVASAKQSSYPAYAQFAVLIKRGGNNCTFEMKLRQAQAAGYQAAIVYNIYSNDLLHMKPDHARPNIRIPSVFVGALTGAIMRSFCSPDIVLNLRSGQHLDNDTPISYILYMIVFEMAILLTAAGVIYRLPKNTCPVPNLPIVKYYDCENLLQDSCAICLEEFLKGDKLRVLQCSHAFHYKCIDKWLQTTTQNCPICRKDLNVKQEAEVAGETVETDETRPADEIPLTEEAVVASETII